MLKQPPEMNEKEVRVIEELRNSKERTKQAIASFMDARLSWYAFDAMQVARTDGFNAPEILAAYISLEGGNIFTIIQAERDQTKRILLTLLAVSELQCVADHLLEKLR